MTQSGEAIGLVNPWTWYPVVASAALVAGALLPVRLGGEELVLWRAADGTARAWSTRCPHRGMRLTLGSVSGGSLICPYHGWTFDGEGYCTHIPAHPDIAPSRAARVRLYPSREQSGYVWAALGEPSVAQPDANGLSEAGLTHLRSLNLKTDTATVYAALLALPLPRASLAGTAERQAWLAAVEPGLMTDGTALALDVSNGDARWHATLRLPSVLKGQFTDLSGTTHFVARIQPAAVGETVLHVALADDATVGMRHLVNAAMVQLRRDVTEPGCDSARRAGIERLGLKLQAASPGVSGIVTSENEEVLA